MELSSKQIFREYGEKYFRKLERDAIRRLRWLERGVIAVGGGAVIDFINHQELAKLGRFIYLEIGKNTLKQRLSMQADLPALVDPYHLDESLEELYATRAPVYERIADEIIKVDSLTEEQVADQICSLITVAQE